jgi:methylamine dehydrogenase accessory protein MauD
MTLAAWVSIAALWVIVICLTIAVLALARQIGVLHERLQPVGALMLPKGLTVGQPAPEIEVITITGESLRIGAARTNGTNTLLIFMSPTCPVCKSLLPALRAIRRSEKPAVDVILASDGSRLEHLDFIAQESLQEFRYVLSEPLGITYGAGRLPHAVLLDAGGIVRANGLVNSREHLDSLFEAGERGVATLQEFMRAKERQVTPGGTNGRERIDA